MLVAGVVGPSSAVVAVVAAAAKNRPVSRICAGETDFDFLQNTGKRGCFSRCLEFQNQSTFSKMAKNRPRTGTVRGFVLPSQIWNFSKTQAKKVFFEVSQIPKSSDFSKMAKNRPPNRPVSRICAGEPDLEF